MTTTNPRLQAGIVGAGIAGLAAAIALRRANWAVEVFERSNFKNEVGAALTISPNSARVLDHWGFDSTRARGTENLQARRMLSNLVTVHQDKFGTMEPQYGHKNWSFHRVDLHDELIRLATHPDASENPPVRIRLGAQITNVDCEKGELITAAGDTVRKELIVIADGAHCRFIEAVTGEDIPMTTVGRSAFRCLIPSEKIMADPDTKKLFENEPAGFLALMHQPTNVFCVTYPCRDGEIMNCVVLHDTESTPRSTENWNSPATMESLQECLKDYHPTAKKMLGMADSVKVYTLMHRRPLDNLVRGKVALVGDAAHNMLPTHAQGTAVALEDSATFEVLFSDLHDPGKVEERLRIFEKVRLGRGAMTQILSNGGPRGHTIPEVVEQVRKYYSGPLPDADSYPYGPQFRDLFFNYDVFEEARKALG